MEVKALFALMLMIVLGVVVHTIVKDWTFSVVVLRHHRVIFIGGLIGGHKRR